MVVALMIADTQTISYLLFKKNTEYLKNTECWVDKMIR